MYLSVLCQDLKDFALQVKLEVDGMDTVLNSPAKIYMENDL